jgi:uncharacterized membrane protein
MNEDIKKEVIKTRESLEKKSKKIVSIEKRVKKQIDREYPLDFNELSDIELETEMEKRVVYLNENLNIINQINRKTGNKLLKILLVIPTLIHFMITKPIPLMKNYLQLNHILLIRLKRLNESLSRMELRLNDLEAIEKIWLQQKET